MKKIILTTLLLCFEICNAQFSYGFKGGLVLSNIEVENIPIKPESKISYSFGVFSEYKFDDLSINLGLSYGEYGSKGVFTGRLTDDPNEEPSYDINVRENMFIVDLTSNYYITESLSIGVGGYYGVINKVEHDLAYGNIDVSDSYEKGDYGLTFKSNYIIYKALFVEAKYNFGIANIIRTSTYETKNRFISLSIGYRFM